MAYKPPHLRMQKENQAPVALTSKLGSPRLARAAGTSGHDDADTFMLTDVLTHYWPEGNRKAADRVTNLIQDSSDATGEAAPTNVDTLGGQGLRPVAKASHSTLNASAEEPEKLVFILLFPGANPQFHGEGIIYVKSNLNLLRREREGNLFGKTNPQTTQRSAQADQAMHEIKSDAGHQSGSAKDGVQASQPDSIGRTTAVFEQKQTYGGTPQTRERMHFTGYYKVDDVHICPPRSEELAVLLDKKWTRMRQGKPVRINRDADAWKRSFGFEWAQIRLLKDNDFEAIHRPPKIERSQSIKNIPDKPGKSVNEMLKEMRLESTKA